MLYKTGYEFSLLQYVFMFIKIEHSLIRQSK
jgi:hypothetical protein